MEPLSCFPFYRMCLWASTYNQAALQSTATLHGEQIGEHKPHVTDTRLQHGPHSHTIHRQAITDHPVQLHGTCPTTGTLITHLEHTFPYVKHQCFPCDTRPKEQFPEKELPPGIDQKQFTLVLHCNHRSGHSRTILSGGL